ncbi:MAG: hypothetical protein AAB458_02710 [Patescibacteria group bacterium]
MVHGRVPTGLQNWEMAQQIVEVLGDENWVPADVARECIYCIVHHVTYPDKETKQSVTLMAEEAARSVFPELAGINEVHIDQIERAYQARKEEDKNNSTS